MVEADGPPMASQYVFVASGARNPPYASGRQVIEELLARRIWMLSGGLAQVRCLREGDQVVFYAAGMFHGTARIGGPAREATSDDALVMTSLGLRAFDAHVALVEPRIWQTPIPIRELLADLTFVKNKRRWGLHLMTGIVRIPVDDFNRIIAGSLHDGAD